MENGVMMRRAVVALVMGVLGMGGCCSEPPSAKFRFEEPRFLLAHQGNIVPVLAGEATGNGTFCERAYYALQLEGEPELIMLGRERELDVLLPERPEPTRGWDALLRAMSMPGRFGYLVSVEPLVIASPPADAVVVPAVRATSSAAVSIFFDTDIALIMETDLEWEVEHVFEARDRYVVRDRPPAETLREVLAAYAAKQPRGRPAELVR